MLQTSFIKFSVARELIFYKPSLKLKMLSYLKSIVEIIFFLKHTPLKPSHDSTDKKILHKKSLSRFNIGSIFVSSMWFHNSKADCQPSIFRQKQDSFVEKSRVL